MELIAVDLFAGCGGISEGLRNAGFKILAGADNNPKYSITYKNNFRETLFFENSLSEFTPTEFLNAIGLKHGELDLLAGGPPCQGFSKNVPRSQRIIDSENNQLVRIFLDYCKELRPKAILMENVAEMRKGFNEVYANEVISRLDEYGYNVTEGIVISADYGVPQMRKRAFFVGIRKDQYKAYTFPSPSHAKLGKNDLFQSTYNDIKAAINDLPSLKHGEGEEESNYTKKTILSEYQSLMRSNSNKLYNHVARNLSDIQFARLSSLKPGQGQKDLPEELKTKGGYSGAYGRLTWEHIAPTITRWVFHPGSGRWGHPEDIRVLTIREVARIQSFPDNFRFYGSYNNMAGQLGNAVPPLVAKTIGEQINGSM